MLVDFSLLLGRKRLVGVEIWGAFDAFFGISQGQIVAVEGMSAQRYKGVAHAE